MGLPDESADDLSLHTRAAYLIHTLCSSPVFDLEHADQELAESAIPLKPRAQLIRDLQSVHLALQKGCNRIALVLLQVEWMVAEALPYENDTPQPMLFQERPPPSRGDWVTGDPDDAPPDDTEDEP
jgi:hypothetical protein